MTLHLPSLLRSFLGVSVLRILGLPMALLANVVLARTLDVSEFGVFALTISLVTIVAIPVNGGLPILLTREIAQYAGKRNWPAYKGLVLVAHRWVLSVAALAGLGMFAWWYFAGTPKFEIALISALLLPILGLEAIRNGILKGLGHPVLAETPASVLQPSFLALGYLGLATFGLATATNALWLYLAATTLVFAVGTIFLVWAQPTESRESNRDIGDLRQWRKSVLPFTMLAAATTLNSQVAVLLLGVFGDAEMVAVLNVAQRSAQLVALPLAIMNTIVAPYFVQALQSGSKDELRRHTRQASRLTLLASMPIGLVFLFFGRPLLAWTFGAPYDDLSFAPLAIIVVAQLISVALGSGGILLAMGGHEKYTLYSLLISLAVVFAVLLCLVGSLGTLGAAIGIAAGTIAAKLFVFFVAKQHLGIWPGLT